MRHLSLSLSVAAITASLLTSSFATTNPGTEEIADEQSPVPVSLELKPDEAKEEAISALYASSVKPSLITPSGGMEASVDKKAPTWTKLAELNRDAAPKPESLNDLPNEMVAEILGKLPPKFLEKAAQVCKDWHDLSKYEIAQQHKKLVDLRLFAKHTPMQSLQTLLTDPKYENLQMSIRDALRNYLLGEGQTDYINLSLHLFPQIDEALAQTRNTHVGTLMAYKKVQGSAVADDIFMKAVQKRQVWALDDISRDLAYFNRLPALFSKIFQSKESNSAMINHWLAEKILHISSTLWRQNTWHRLRRAASVASNAWLGSPVMFPRGLDSEAALSKISEGDFLRWAIEFGNSKSAYQRLRACDLNGSQWKDLLQKLVREKNHVFAARCLLDEALAECVSETSWKDWIKNGFKHRLALPERMDYHSAVENLIIDCLRNKKLACDIFGKEATQDTHWATLEKALINARVQNFLICLKNHPSQATRSDGLLDSTFLLEQLKTGNKFAIEQLAKYLVSTTFSAVNNSGRDFDWYFKILRDMKG